MSEENTELEELENIIHTLREEIILSESHLNELKENEEKQRKYNQKLEKEMEFLHNWIEEIKKV